MQVVPVALAAVASISAVRIFVPKDFAGPAGADKRESVWKSISEVARRFSDGVPMLDPVEDMGIDETTKEGRQFAKAVGRIESLQKRILKNPLHSDGDRRDQLVGTFQHRLSLQRQIEAKEKELKGFKSLSKSDKLRQMKRVLRRLGHIDSDGIVQLKGRVACEINSADELLVTELLFDGVFNDLHVNVIVALLAVFANTGGKPEDEGVSTLPEELQGPFRQLRAAARKVATVQQECKLDIDPDEYEASFNVENMKIAYEWARKKKFSEICKITDQFEGSIIRMIRRLEELIREVASSCAALGNEELKKKFEQGMVNIKRDIVFAASLYL